MFEVLEIGDPRLGDYDYWSARYDEDPPEPDLDALARDPANARHFRDDPDDFSYATPTRCPTLRRWSLDTQDRGRCASWILAVVTA